VQEHQCVVGNADMKEIWADIRGYEGRYQVSNLGRVKSLARMRRGKHGSQVPVPEKIMALTSKKDTGRTKPYLEVRLRDGGSRFESSRSFLVHRLVADAFIKPLELDEQIDHINGVHGDNRVENLRVLHYREHAKLHPTFYSSETRAEAQKAIQEKLKSGWRPGQYKRTKAQREQARRNASSRVICRCPDTGRFLSDHSNQGIPPQVNPPSQPKGV